MNKIINNILKYKYTYLIIFLTLLIMFGIFSIDRYALDTYFYESNGMRYNAINPYFYNGRIFMTIFLYILSILNVSFSLGKLLSWLLAFISLYISTILCFNILSKYKKSNIINVLLSICLVANPFIIEYFMFPEYTGIMCLGILFTFISIFTIDYYFQKSNKIALAFAILAAMCSVMCYQGGISLLFIIPLLFIFKDSKTLKEFLKKLLIVCLVFGIAALTTAILSKILGAERLGNNFNFIKSIKEALKGSGILLTTTYQTLPKYLLIIIAIICSVGTLVTIEKKPKTILFYVLCILSLLIVPVIPHFFAAYIWLVPRSCLGYGLLAAISILFYLIYNKNNKYVNGIYILSMLTIILKYL